MNEESKVMRELESNVCSTQVLNKLFHEIA